MKRIICAVLVCLLLCGCGGPAVEDTRPVQPAVVPTEPSGSYEAGSPLEQSSGGAVRVYPQTIEAIWDIRTMGQDVLVFSGTDTLTLTRLTGENLFRIAQTELDIYISADAPSLYISEDRVIYYDYQTRELVHLDGQLQPIRRVAMPEDLTGEPVLTKDRSRFYYCTAQGLRYLDMESGISRLVKEMHFADQFVQDLLLGDSVVRVAVADEDGWGETLFLDAETGALMGAIQDEMQLTSGEDWFYASRQEGLICQMIFGNGEEVHQLHPKDYMDSGVFIPDCHGAVLSHWENEELTLDYYDLASGCRTNSLQMGAQCPVSLTGGENGLLYFLIFREDGTQAICRWDTKTAKIEEDTAYTGPWYTMDSPDKAGLAECRAYAEKLSQQFSLNIQLVPEAINLKPENYDLIPEYQVPVIWDALTQLETLLRAYPAGMFPASVEGLENGKLTLLLVRDIRGSYTPGSLDGLHFWLDDESFVALAMGDTLERTVYHQLFHALETRLLSRSIACYRWDELNPKGFAYDYDYIANQSRDGSEYLEDTTRSFIDTYSMSFPKEDRARVMEYACMPGNESYFISYTMQKKLRALCEGIREAYDLQDYPEALLWEQYLESPIHP